MKTNRWRGRAGQSLVEMAMVLPVLAFLTFGLLDFGRAYYFQVSVTNAAREGARAFAATRCEASHISLFRREQGPEDIRRHLLSQDLIYVGGGSVVSLLGVWRAHGLDEVLRECWRRGIVLCGLSAGSLCWFSEAVTAFHGPPQRVAGLGLLATRRQLVTGPDETGAGATPVAAWSESY